MSKITTIFCDGCATMINSQDDKTNRVLIFKEGNAFSLVPDNKYYLCPVCFKAVNEAILKELGRHRA